MNIALWFLTFVNDDKVKAILVLVAVDFVFGVCSALKAGTFQLSYVAAFVRDDLLSKVVPYFVVYAAALTAGHTTILFNVIDFGDVADTIFGIVVAAMAGSIYKSLGELGFQLPLPQKLQRALV